VSATRAPSWSRTEARTVGGVFVAYGAMFLDRLAPLYLVTLIATDLGVPAAREGSLALLIGLGWALAMPLVRATSGRFDNRRRLAGAVILSGLVSIGSAGAGGWALFVALRGLGGLAAASGAPAATALVFAVAPERRRGRDIGLMHSSTRIMGSLVSPVVVTAVAVAAGWRPALVVSGVLAVLSAGWLLLVAPRTPQLPPAARSDRDATHGPAPVTVATMGHAPSPSPAGLDDDLEPDDELEPEYELERGGGRNLVLCTLACVLLLTWLTVWSQSAVEMLRTWLTIDAAAAGRLVGWFGFGSAVGALGVPPLSDRIGRRAALSLASGIGGASGFAVGVLAATGVALPASVLIVLVIAAGTTMGGLPLVIAIIPAESVRRGDVGRALTGPIAGGEVIGAAALPALAAVLAVSTGRAWVVALAALGVVVLAGLSWALEPLGTRSAGVVAPPRH
jgi:MFS family permease